MRAQNKSDMSTLTRSERRSVVKHLAFMKEDIERRGAVGESTQVMRIAYESIQKLLKLSDAAREVNKS